MSALTLVIGNKNYSSWSLRPWLLLKHFNIEFNEIKIPLYQSASALALEQHSPSRKVPALIHGDLTVWDSLAICEYISENLLQNAGWPEETKARALARSISAEMHSGFFALRNELPMNCRCHIPGFTPSNAAIADITRIKSIWQNCLENHSDRGDWLLGTFSIADCMFAPVVLRFKIYSITLEPILQRYADNVLAHSAIKEWVAAGQAESEMIAKFEVAEY